MQLKLAIEGAIPSAAHNSTTQYNIVVTCNKCAGLHEMEISVTMENGPVDKRSIGDLYDERSLPKSLANLTGTSISCPRQGDSLRRKTSTKSF